MIKIVKALALSLGIVLFSSGVINGVASASTHTIRHEAVHWAEKQAGKPYVWGATGPNAYDCSGLVMKAYHHAGINLPRTTTDMISSPKVRRISRRHAKRGDLAFFGTGHVELYLRPHRDFAAENSGVNWYHWFRSWGWFPTIYFRVIHSNRRE